MTTTDGAWIDGALCDVLTGAAKRTECQCNQLSAANALLERVQKRGPTRGDGALNGDIKAHLAGQPAAPDPFTKGLRAFLRDWNDWMSQEMYGETIHDGWEEQDREKLFEHIEALQAELARRESKA